MKKLLLFLMVFLLGANITNAKVLDIDKIILNSGIEEQSTISISVKNLDTSKIVYERNAKKLLHPASSLKLLTIMPCLKYLTKDYRMNTLIYKNSDNDVYIKLGANPYLSTVNIKALLTKIKESGVEKINNLYIDASIIDNIEWGIGWMWDDDINSLAPKYSVYNLDKNLITLKIIPTEKGKEPKIVAYNSTNEHVMNYLKTDDTTNIGIARFTWSSPDLIYLYGTVKNEKVIQVPTNNPKKYFLNELKKQLINCGIKYEKEITEKEVAEDTTLVAQISTPINVALKDILQNSNNMVSETLFKLAAGVFSKSQGSTSEGIDMFKEYYKNINKENNRFTIVDASGFSRNNLISADFVTDALIFNKNDENFEYMKSNMATPKVGTLKTRLPELQNKLFAKSGSLSGISSLTGYLKAENGENYVFSIIIQNFMCPTSKVKKLENDIIEALYAI